MSYSSRRGQTALLSVIGILVLFTALAAVGWLSSRNIAAQRHLRVQSASVDQGLAELMAGMRTGAQYEEFTVSSGMPARSAMVEMEGSKTTLAAVQIDAEVWVFDIDYAGGAGKALAERLAADWAPDRGQVWMNENAPRDRLRAVLDGMNVVSDSDRQALRAWIDDRPM